MQEMMKSVVGIVNLFHGRALNHRRFQYHLAASDAEYGNVLFYNSLLCLSHSAFLQRFVALFSHVISFLE